VLSIFFFFQAEDGIRDRNVTGVQTCALPICLENLQDSSSNIIQSRAELGARMNRLELIEDRLENQVVIAKDTMAKNEGVEFEEAVTNLLTQEVIHRAALSAGSKIIQPSLVDFLR